MRRLKSHIAQVNKSYGHGLWLKGLSMGIQNFIVTEYKGVMLSGCYHERMMLAWWLNVSA